MVLACLFIHDKELEQRVDGRFQGNRVLSADDDLDILFSLLEIYSAPFLAVEILDFRKKA
jgi:hypothetical protein